MLTLLGLCCLSVDAEELHVKVAPVHGVPTFAISRDPDQGYRAFSGPCFETYVPKLRFFEQFAATGTKLYTFNTTPSAGDYAHAPPVWLGPDEWDYAELDERCRRVLAADPDAMLLPRVMLGTPDWWLEQHPEESEVLDHGATIYRDPNRNPTVPKNRPFPSVVSRKWRTDIGEALRRFIQHIQQSDYADHVFGYVLTGLDTEEWYHWSSGSDQLAGYSPHMRDAFRVWLQEKYGSEANLQAAWRKPHLRFADVEVPTRAERFDLNQGTFRDPATRMNVIDFYIFYNEIIPDTIDYFAQIAKESTGGRKAIGAFYGFMYEFRGDPEYGHNALARFNESPYLDFIYVTASYGNRQLGGADYLRSPAYSVRLHDKLWYHDNDTVTFKATEMWANQPESDNPLNNPDAWQWTLGYTTNLQDTIGIFRRSFGFSLCLGAHHSFFDLHGGYFDDPGILEEIARVNQAAEYAKRYDRGSNSEILVVSDEASCAYATFRSSLLEHSLLSPQLMLAQIGAPADHVLLSDLQNLDCSQYKLVLFLNCYRIDSDQRAIIQQQLKRDGKHLVWCYAAGAFDEQGSRPDGVSELAEINVVEGPRDERVAPQIKLLGSEEVFGKDQAYCHLMHVVDPEADTLGTLPGTDQVTLARKSQPDWTSYYALTPVLSSAFYRQLACDAGVHIWNDGDDTFYANKTFVALHANGAGERTIYFPWACNVTDVMTGERVAANQKSFTYDFKHGETLVLKWRTRL